MDAGYTKPDIEARSYRFAVAVTAFCHYHEAGYDLTGVLLKQLLRSGTSVGANIQEAQGGQSRADFLNKMSIAYKEARETRYWLGVLMDSDVMCRGYETHAVLSDVPHKQLTSPPICPADASSPQGLAGYFRHKAGNAIGGRASESLTRNSVFGKQERTSLNTGRLSFAPTGTPGAGIPTVSAVTLGIRR